MCFDHGDRCFSTQRPLARKFKRGDQLRREDSGTILDVLILANVIDFPMFCLLAAWAGVINLPSKICIWWIVDAASYTIVGSIALGIVAEKLAPVE